MGVIVSGGNIGFSAPVLEGFGDLCMKSLMGSSLGH